ncbi:MAG: hypothetical protein J6B02_00635, partial [Selenomonadales bacterium]|nr:hypothetical protein [Selenomonadales bacterium]
KAQWDADLGLDAEYRIAEAQGFPNGIPGGKERGGIFYFLAQRKKEYKRECEEVQEKYAKDYEKHFSLRQGTDILGGKKLIMRYAPYGVPPNYEVTEPSILPQEDFPWENYKSEYDTDALNNVIRSAAAKATSNIRADILNTNQPSYDQPWNRFGSYGQRKETNESYMPKYIANSDADDNGQVKLRKEVVVNNPTGIAVFEHMTELEPFFKPPLSPLFGHTFQDNYRLAEQILKQYENEISIAADLAESVVPDVALELAEKAIVLLPPNLKMPALILLCSIDVYMTAKEAYDKWSNKVNAYAKRHECSEDVAKQNVSLAKEFHDAFMFFSVQEWLKYVFRSVDIPANVKITLCAELVECLPEQDIGEWKKDVKEMLNQL